MTTENAAKMWKGKRRAVRSKLSKISNTGDPVWNEDGSFCFFLWGSSNCWHSHEEELPWREPEWTSIITSTIDREDWHKGVFGHSLLVWLVCMPQSGASTGQDVSSRVFFCLNHFGVGDRITRPEFLTEEQWRESISIGKSRGLTSLHFRMA